MLAVKPFNPYHSLAGKQTTLSIQQDSKLNVTYTKREELLCPTSQQPVVHKLTVHPCPAEKCDAVHPSTDKQGSSTEETTTVQCTYFSGHHYVSFTFDKMVTTYASVLCWEPVLPPSHENPFLRALELSRKPRKLCISSFYKMLGIVVGTAAHRHLLTTQLYGTMVLIANHMIFHTFIVTCAKQLPCPPKKLYTAVLQASVERISLANHTHFRKREKDLVNCIYKPCPGCSIFLRDVLHHCFSRNSSLENSERGLLLLGELKSTE